MSGTGSDSERDGVVDEPMPVAPEGGTTELEDDDPPIEIVDDDDDLVIDVVDSVDLEGHLLDDEVSFVEVDEDDVEFVEAAPADSAELLALRERVAELEAESKSAVERMKRVAADAENIKRRTEREKEEVRRYGTEKVLTDMIPVLDNLQRAVQHARASDDKSSLLEGVGMVQRQFEQVLGRFGCEAFDSLGKPFDPQRHEAVQQIESAEHPGGTVVEEYQRGYFLRDRLLRPALVVVSRLPPGVEAPTPAAEVEGDGLVDDVPIAVDSAGETHEPSEPSSDESALADDGSGETLH